jgi:hypothetical protein
MNSSLQVVVEIIYRDGPPMLGQVYQITRIKQNSHLQTDDDAVDYRPDPRHL